MSLMSNVYDTYLDDFYVGNALETMMSFKSLFALDDCDVRDYCNVHGVHNGLGAVRYEICTVMCRMALTIMMSMMPGKALLL
jgi:hypothetical protein